MVFELLTENGLEAFYELAESAGPPMQGAGQADPYLYLDEPAVREKVVDYTDDRRTRVRFRIPAMHCIACVWLLENLYRLQPGIGGSEVHFPRQEVSITFDNRRLKLSQVVGLLDSIGYGPELKYSVLDRAPRSGTFRRLWVQLGVAGFVFGNVMLFSLPGYFGMDRFSGPGFARFFGWASLLLALPVMVYSAQDYWKSAWQSLRQRRLQIEVPIALGLAALFGQSVLDVVGGVGEGYFASFAGLVFFLLIGRVFQRKTYERLSFDRDYKSFFPLSVTRQSEGKEERVSLASLKVGDVLMVRHGELVPADARLRSGHALIDYSFVTGESQPVGRKEGDLLYAGGRQTAGGIEVETVKAVSQSYLTSLWNQEAFRKEGPESVQNLTNRFSRHFVKAVMAVAVGSALYWAWHDPSRAWLAFTAVLIVACPCALALAAPFALGTASRELGRREVFLKSPDVVETLSRVNTVIFDKTGTLTAPGEVEVEFHGEALSEQEAGWVYSVTRHSTHPHAVRIEEALAGDYYPEVVWSFLETPGQGMEGNVLGHEIWMGAADWLSSRGVTAVQPEGAAGSLVHVAIDGMYRGGFALTHPVRPETARMLERLAGQVESALLSGDQPREKERYRAMFGPGATLAFEQTPASKLNFVRQRQAEGRSVMMVGDGLNDAGALQQSDVGVAVVERLSAFSPASDVILSADQVSCLDDVLRFSRSTMRVIKLCLLVSVLYNLAGVAFAARGVLSPVFCAILMPISSITVVGLASGLTVWCSRRGVALRAGVAPPDPGEAGAGLRPAKEVRA